MVDRMLKNCNLLLLLIFLIACSTLNDQPTLGKALENTDSDLKPYIKDFVNLTNPYFDQKLLEKSSISFIEMTTQDGVGVVGYCQKYTLKGGPLVAIDRIYWNVITEEEREALMLHELGHCFCDLPHAHLEGYYNESKPDRAPGKKEDRLNAGFLEDGCPASLMYPFMFSANCYKKHRDHYRYELRLQCRSYTLQKKN